MLRPSSPRAFRLSVFTLLALFSLPFVPASAQETGAEPETSEIKVAALLCIDRGCVEFGDRVGDFTITAADINTGETLDSCVTDAASETQGCVLTVAADAQWTLTYDEAQTPEGYEYMGSIIGVEGGAHGVITYLPFIPLPQETSQDDVDDPALPVAELPSTGTDGPDATGSSHLGTVALALVTLTLAGAGLHLRRR